MTERPGAGVVLDERRLILLLRYGNELAVTRGAGGAVTGCVVSGLGEIVPIDLFAAYLAAGWVEDAARGVRFALSARGRKRLR
jgi:hypothetical protein